MWIVKPSNAIIVWTAQTERAVLLIINNNANSYHDKQRHELRFRPNCNSNIDRLNIMDAVVNPHTDRVVQKFTPSKSAASY